MESDPNVCVDHKNMVLLKELVDKSNATVVMSSGWRLWFDDNMQPVDGDSHMLDTCLKEYGIEVKYKTPDFSTDEIRQKRTFSHVKGKEIMAWLDDNKHVTDFVVLDDLMLREGYINNRLVKTDPEVGLTSENINEALRTMGVIPFSE